MTVSINKKVLEKIIKEELRRHQRKKLLEYDIGDATGAAYDTEGTSSQSSLPRISLVDGVLGILGVLGFVDPTQLVGLSLTEAAAALLLAGTGDYEGAAIVMATAPLIGGPLGALGRRTARAGADDVVRLTDDEATELVQALGQLDNVSPSEARAIADAMKDVNPADPAVQARAREIVEELGEEAGDAARATREVIEDSGGESLAATRASNLRRQARDTPEPSLGPRGRRRFRGGMAVIDDLPNIIKRVDDFKDAVVSGRNITNEMAEDIFKLADAVQELRIAKRSVGNAGGRGARNLTQEASERWTATFQSATDQLIENAHKARRAIEDGLGSSSLGSRNAAKRGYEALVKASRGERRGMFNRAMLGGIIGVTSVTVAVGARGLYSWYSNNQPNRVTSEDPLADPEGQSILDPDTGEVVDDIIIDDPVADSPADQKVQDALQNTGPDENVVIDTTPGPNYGNIVDLEADYDGDAELRRWDANNR